MNTLGSLPPSLRTAITRALPEFGDIDASATVIVTGHLLVEEALTALLDRCVLDAEALRDARLSFSQRARLVRALCSAPTEYDRACWSLIEKLNKLRNALAHTLDRGERAKKIAELIAHYASVERNVQNLANFNKSPQEGQLLSVVGASLGFLASVSDEREERSRRAST